MKFLFPLLFLFFAASATPSSAVASETGSEDHPAPDASAPLFRGRDGMFDVSNWLLDRKGFLPVPIVITEPAVGYGGGIAVVFFSESLRDAQEHSRESRRYVPPNLYIGTGFATGNGTYGGGIGGILSFGEDRWRYRGLLGAASANLDFYGIGGSVFDNAPEIGYTLKGWASFQQLSRRLGDSNFFVGARWLYLNLSSSLDLDNGFDRTTRRPLSGIEKDYRNSGLGILVSHDSRDNFFTPSRGWSGEIVGTFYDPSWGSDNRFASYRAHFFGYHPFTLFDHTLVAGLRLDFRAAAGDVPFFQEPFIDMRGIPVGRYQDERVLVSELELRYSLTHRWAAIAFAGVGRAWGKRDGFSETPSVASKGIGVRYLLAERFGLYAGLDYAWGPEKGVPYIQIGSAWR